MGAQDHQFGFHRLHVGHCSSGGLHPFTILPHSYVLFICVKIWLESIALYSILRQYVALLHELMEVRTSQTRC